MKFRIPVLGVRYSEKTAIGVDIEFGEVFWRLTNMAVLIFLSNIG